MKTTIQKTVDEEVEITLPYFFKTAAHNVALISEKEAIIITNFMGLEIALRNSAERVMQEFAGIEKTESNLKEFNDAYAAAASEIINATNKLL